MDEENKSKFNDVSFPLNSRDLVLHEGDLDLSEPCYRWQFGRTPRFTEEQMRSNPGEREVGEDVMKRQAHIEWKDSLTANQPDIALHPHNKERRMPAGQVSDSFMFSLRPGTKDQDQGPGTMSFSRKEN